MFNYKKIASVLASAVMLSSTIGFAAALNYPAPFVTSGSADGAVVVGLNADISDLNAALDVGQSLNTLVTAGSGSASGSSVTGGDSVKLEKEGTNFFNLNNQMDDFFTSLDEGELSTVLSKGVYTNDENDDFDYEQEISIGDGITLTYFQDSNFMDDKPVLGFDISDGQLMLNYTLDFTPDSAETGNSWTSGNDLETTELSLLGKNYYVLSARNTTATNHKIILLDSADSAIVNEGEANLIVAGEIDYSVSITHIGTNEIILDINGASTNKLNEGDVFKLSGGSYVAIKNILYNSKDSVFSKAEISIGSGKIELEHNKEVEINGDPISDVNYEIEGSDETVSYQINSYITLDGNDLSKIVLEWKLDDDLWMAEGSEVLLPGFGSIKLSYAGFYTPESEETKIRANGDDSIQVSTVVTDGPVTFDILSLNSSQTGFDSLGKDDNEKLFTNSSTNTITISLNESEDTMFVATWVSGDDYESYVLGIKSIDDANGKNKTTIKNFAASGTNVVFSEVTDTKDLGQVQLELTAANDDLKTATVTLTRAGSTGTLYADRIITKSGLRFLLPVDSVSSTGSNYINLTSVDLGGPTTWNMIFDEEDKDGNIASGNNFNVTLGVDADDGGEPTTITGISTYQIEDGSDLYSGYMLSDLATRVLHDKPSNGLNELTITYHGAESYADVYVSEVGATITPGATGTTVGSGGQVLIVKDSEMSSVADRNLVVIGGSCINTAAARILDSDSPLCTSAFTDATGVGPGQYIIKTVQSPWAADKVAMLVAGYDAADTADAVRKAMEGVVTDSGSETIYPISGTN